MQVNVVVVVGCKREVSELKDSEELESYYFAAQEGHQEQDVADDLHSGEQVGNAVGCSTLRRCVVERGHHGLVGEH